MIILKSREEIEIMRWGGRIAGEVLAELEKMIKPGITTADLEKKTSQELNKRGAKPAFLGYRGFPASLCISINEEVIHGIPGERKLKEGDLVGLDLGVVYQDFFTDLAATYPVGKVNGPLARLLKVSSESLYLAIEKMKKGGRIGDLSSVIQSHNEKNGFAVVRDFSGHGIGRALHEEPAVPNYGSPNSGPRLKIGLVLAIEAMVNQGDAEIVIKKDGWTVVTKDGSRSAHFEHTVALTENGPEILTK